MDKEQILVERARAGDQEAFGALVQAYQTPVYNLTYRMLGRATEAEEAAQETFLRVYRHLHTYNSQQKLSSWILSIASHYCIDRLRRRRFSWLSLDTPPAQAVPETETEGPERRLLENEKQQEIQELLAQLPESYRLVLVLRYWHDLSYEEIAQVLDSTESAIKSRLHRARQLMADYLGHGQTQQVKKTLERSIPGHALP